MTVRVEREKQAVDDAVAEDANPPVAAGSEPVVVGLSDEYVAVFGESDEASSFDLNFLPDREQAVAALGHAGNVAGVVGGLANLQGLYQVDAATRALLGSGAQLAVKDGANLGAIFMKGKLVGQARFVPVARGVAGLAVSIGPALAALALQTMLMDIKKLVAVNADLTSQVLGAIRREQWAELDSVVMQVDEALGKATKCQGIPDTLWDKISGLDGQVKKQESLIRREIDQHIRQLKARSGNELRTYLLENGSAIAFDAHALLRVERARLGYSLLTMARARQRGQHDPKEEQYAQLIGEEAVQQGECLTRIRPLLGGITRQLGMIAQPGETGSWSLANRKEKQSRETAGQLLDIVLLLAERLQAVHEEVDDSERDDLVPEGVNIAPALKSLRWHLDPNEELLAVAVVSDAPGDKPGKGEDKGPQKTTAILPWFGDKSQSEQLVAVTNRGILVDGLKKFGQDEESLKRLERTEDWRVRVPAGEKPARVQLKSKDQAVAWQFPETVDKKAAQRFATLLKTGAEPASEAGTLDAAPSRDVPGREIPTNDAV